MGLALKGELDHAVLGSLDQSFPAKVDVRLGAAHVEGDPEVISSIVDLQVGDLRRNGCPVLVANRGIDPAKDFVFSHTKVAQKDVVGVEAHRGRASP